MRPFVAVLAAFLAFPVAAAAHTESQRYVGSADLVQLSVGAFNVGGARFAPQSGETSVTVTVVDDVAGPGLAITVCQDLAEDHQCDSGTDPRVVGCSPLTLDLKSLVPVGVWVQGTASAVVGCTTLPATRGTITAAFT